MRNGGCGRGAGGFGGGLRLGGFGWGVGRGGSAGGAVLGAPAREGGAEAGQGGECRGDGSQTATVRYASTAAIATAAGTPNAISTPAIPPLTEPGSGSVLATWPTKYASTTTGSEGAAPNACSVAHSTAASNAQ